MQANTQDIFWSKVQKHKNCCWIWTGGKNSKGYGIWWFSHRKWRTHRLAYFFIYKIDPGNLCVLHKCDNPSCVRPDHLYIGTHKDNRRDCIARGRHWTHLSIEQVRLIRRLRQLGYLYREIAKKCRVGNKAIYEITSGKTHKFVS